MRERAGYLGLRRLPGAVLLGAAVLVLAAAGMPDGRVFTAPEPRVRLEAIAARPWGWTAQAVIFPIGFTAVALGTLLCGRMLIHQRHPARMLAEVAGWLGVVAAALWVPISMERMETGVAVHSLLAGPPAAWRRAFETPTFTAYTVTALLSTGALAAALAWSGVRRRAGAAFAVLAAGGLVAYPLLGDWPPFATYLLVLGLGISLFTGTEPIRRTAPERSNS